MKSRLILLMLLLVIPCFAYAAEGADDSNEISADADADALAKATQNPLASMISLPFQSNWDFDYGPQDGTRYVMNIQPVVPFTLNEEWNLITRTILPIVSRPSFGMGDSRENGIGDTSVTAWFSPAKAGKFVWGAGPTINLPTASDSSLGSEKWSMGPSVVGVYMSGPWVAGVLASNVWSFAGDSDRDDVSLFFGQYFVNYNLPDQWYLVSSPAITANWEASSDDTWTIPFGGGIGKLFKVGKLPINTSAQLFYNLERPETMGEWTARLQVQLLFPKKK